jgi:BNR repeat-like domain
MPIQRPVLTVACLVALVGGMSGGASQSLAPASADRAGGSASSRNVATSEPGVRALPRTLVSTRDHRFSEFSAAVDPNDPQHMAVAGMDWDSDSGNLACTVRVSNDGGRTWRSTAAVPGLDTPLGQYDPWITIDNDGKLHLLCIQFQRDPSFEPFASPPVNLLMHSMSENDGRSWSTAERVGPRDPDNGVDKSSIHAAGDGTIYACLDEQPTPEPALVVYMSDDGGATWDRHQILDDVLGLGPESNFGACNGFAEGPNGAVYLNWTALFGEGPTSFVGTVATFDSGHTWTNPASIEPTRRAPDSDDDSFTRAAVSIPRRHWGAIAASQATGHVFWASQAWNAEDDRYEVHLYRSTDRGANYQPVTLPRLDSTHCRGCHIAFPRLAVDDQGRLALQVTLANEGGLVREELLLVTTDEGQTWMEPISVAGTGPDQSYLDAKTWIPRNPQAISRMMEWTLEHPKSRQASMDSLRLPRADHLIWGGDYWQMLPRAGGGFVAMWIDHRNGYPQVWASQIAITGPRQN